MARIAAGVKRYVLQTDAPFITSCDDGLTRPTKWAHYILREFGASVGSAITDPIGTITAGGGGKVRHVAAEMVKPPLQGQHIFYAQEIADFLRQHGAWDEREVVTVDDYIIVDIGMRMLKSYELAAAQGFPDDYMLAAPYKGGTLSETDQRHKIGNSVCPPVAAALVGANYRPQLRTAERSPQGWLFETEAA